MCDAAQECVVPRGEPWTWSVLASRANQRCQEIACDSSPSSRRTSVQAPPPSKACNCTTTYANRPGRFRIVPNSLPACSPGALLRPACRPMPLHPISPAVRSSYSKSAPPSVLPSLRSSTTTALIRTWCAFHCPLCSFPEADSHRMAATSTRLPSSATSATLMPTGGTSRTAVTLANPYMRTMISWAR